MRNMLFEIMLVLLGLLTACSHSNTDIYGTSYYSNPAWQTITATDARSMMELNDNFILLDVRTIAEFQNIRIEGAVLIPYNEISNRALKELSDKGAIILVYCQSGRRSALAAANLVELGFSSVYDFGGIINWPYETISG